MATARRIEPVARIRRGWRPFTTRKRPVPCRALPHGSCGTPGYRIYIVLRSAGGVEKQHHRNYRQSFLLHNRGAGICRRAAGEILSRRSLRSTPCRSGALTGARGRGSIRVSGWVTLVGSSPRRWAPSLTLSRRTQPLDGEPTRSINRACSSHSEAARAPECSPSMFRSLNAPP